MQTITRLSEFSFYIGSYKVETLGEKPKHDGAVKGHRAPEEVEVSSTALGIRDATLHN